MEISALLIKQIGSLIIMGAAGWFLRRKSMITSEGAKGISAVCLYICVPCSLFYSFQTEVSKEKIAGFVFALLATIIVHVLFFTEAWGVKRIWSFDVVEELSMIYSNAGNLVIPLVIGVFGEEYVFYTSAYLIVQTVLLWTHARMRIEETGKIDWKKILIHPCMLAICAGLVCFGGGIHMPEMVANAMEGMAHCVGALSMFTVGFLVAEMNLKQVFGNRHMYLVAFFRLLLFPILACIGIWVLKKIIPWKIDRVIAVIVLLATCGPVSATIMQQSQMFGKRADYASAVNVVTTLFSIVTMPVMMYAAQWLF